jgi:hypothetical protein
MMPSRTTESMPCLYCGKAFRSPLSLAHHLDSRHQGWVELVLTKLGIEVPKVYPIPEYRAAIAEFVSRRRPRPRVA